MKTPLTGWRQVTTPTQPPDPRVQRIADALDVWSDTVGYESHRRLARVLVEELGGRDANVAATEIDPRIVGWMDVCKTLDDVDPTWSTRYNSTDAAILAIRQLAAQQRENAETIKALKGRVETAEAANTELDNARKSAEQSARDLRENNATLRAELDAIKGAQDEVTCETRSIYGNVSVKRLVRYVVTAAPIQHLHEWTYETLDDVMRLWPELEDKRAALEALRHPAPALPVVGACVVEDGKPLVTYTNTFFGTQADKEAVAMDVAKSMGATAHIVHLGAPLSTEGGK